MKLAIIGCGAIVEMNHLPALESVPEVSVAGFVDPDASRARRMAKRYRACWRDDTRDVHEWADAALVAVPNAYHARMSAELLQRGLHIACEKPMALSVDEAELLRDAVEKSHRSFVVVHQLKYLSSVQELKRIIDSKMLGDLHRIELALGWKFAWPSRSGFYFNRELAGGGVLVDLGCHLLDLAHWIFGCFRTRMLSMAREDDPDAMDTAVTASLDFQNRVQGLVRCSRQAVLNNEITVDGTRGAVRASLDSQRMVVDLKGSPLCRTGPCVLTMPSIDPFVEFWRRFASQVRIGAPGDSVAEVRNGCKVVQDTVRLYAESPVAGVAAS